ncbi:signal peptidase I [Streptomyces sp. NPDC059957]|uniref:signal peptidase I n=1 Tax=Streptomyces sp. NPDC059957 TaxID=3347016 RepID=UPI00364C3546
MGRDQRRPGRRMGIWAVGLMVLGAVLFVGAGAGVRFFLADEYSHQFIPAHAMEPAYSPGDEVWFRRVAPQEVRRGDAVLATPPASWGIGGDAFKRVIALGGDRLSWAKGDATLTLNGKPLVEPYVKDPAIPAMAPFDVTVPEGRMFVMGDNRWDSVDSLVMAATYGNDGTLPLSAVRGVPTEMPTEVLVLGALGALGGNAFLVGGGLGIASLVARRRAEKAARNAVAAGSVHEAAASS